MERPNNLKFFLRCDYHTRTRTNNSKLTNYNAMYFINLIILKHPDKENKEISTTRLQIKQLIVKTFRSTTTRRC